MILLTLFAALFGGVVGFAATGFGAAMLLGSIFGHREGSAEMAGFFTFGPIGGVAGALLGAGLVLRRAAQSRKWGRGLIVSACVLTAMGGVLLAVVSSPDRGPSYSEVIQFELEYPSAALADVEVPSSNAMWGAAGGESPDTPISQFFEKKCSGDLCVLNGSVAALGPMDNFRIAASIGQRKYRYRLDLPSVIAGPIDWSAWRQGEGARIRWRVVKQQ